MRIQSLQVNAEQALQFSDSIQLSIEIVTYPAGNGPYAIKQLITRNDLESLFDMVWREIGEQMKRHLIAEESARE